MIQQDIPKYRKIGIKTITSVTNSALDSKITDSQSGFRAYSKKVLDEIVPSEYGMGVSTEILIKASKKKFRIEEVPIVILYEGETSTHNPVSHGVSVLTKYNEIHFHRKTIKILWNSRNNFIWYWNIFYDLDITSIY